jgi:hypothetical protein
MDKARFLTAPCYICGYNGPGYFQPETHPCAKEFHENPKTYADGIAQNSQTIAEYEDVLKNKRELTRAIDIALNGKNGAAEQAGLGDILAQIPAIKERLIAQGRREAAEAYCNICKKLGIRMPGCICDERKAILGIASDEKADKGEI